MADLRCAIRQSVAKTATSNYTKCVCKCTRGIDIIPYEQPLHNERFWVFRNGRTWSSELFHNKPSVQRKQAITNYL